MADLVPLPLEMDYLLRPQRAQHGNLLLTPSPTVMEILAQGLVLDRIPANANPQPQSTTAEHIDLCGLLGNQGGLALRQDEDGSHQLQFLGNASKITHEGQGFVEIALVSIR